MVQFEISVLLRLVSDPHDGWLCAQAMLKKNLREIFFLRCCFVLVPSAVSSVEFTLCAVYIPMFLDLVHPVNMSKDQCLLLLAALLTFHMESKNGYIQKEHPLLGPISSTRTAWKLCSGKFCTHSNLKRSHAPVGAFFNGGIKYLYILTPRKIEK
jgi:hypothetical protein